MKTLLRMTQFLKGRFGRLIGFAKTAIYTYQQKQKRLRGLNQRVRFERETGIRWETYSQMTPLERARLLRDFSSK